MLRFEDFASQLNGGGGAKRERGRMGPGSRVNGSVGRGLKVAAELPHSFQEFLVGRIPQSSPVEVGAQLPDCGHDLALTHLGGDFGQRLEGRE